MAFITHEKRHGWNNFVTLSVRNVRYRPVGNAYENPSLRRVRLPSDWNEIQERLGSLSHFYSSTVRTQLSEN